MKLYTSIGPNPRVVRMFMAEKGVEIPFEHIDLMAGETRQAAHLARNPAGQTPALELDDGSFLTEITAVCEYLEETHANPPLIGTTPEERANTRMWTRRIDINIVEPMTNGFRYSEGLPIFQSRVKCIPHAADDLKALAQENLTWLDGLIAGRRFIAGDKLTLADILLFCFLEFGASVGQRIATSNKNVVALLDRIRQRPSAATSSL